LVVSLDLSRLAATLNRLERSIQIGIYKKSDSIARWKDGEVRVMTRGFGDLVAKLGDNKLGDKVVMEVLVRCWSDGDVVVRSW
ncbi:hypothetical protein Tco_1211231, partial [Tanacetum coccineum]